MGTRLVSVSFDSECHSVDPFIETQLRLLLGNDIGKYRVITKNCCYKRVLVN